jgi:predicted metal-binding membrane protein
LVRWVLMIFAMMLPLALPAVRATAFGSLWRRRNLAVGAFLAGYLFVWIVSWSVYGMLFALLRAVRLSSSHWVVAAAFLVSAVWQMSGLKRHLLAASHRTQPLAPAGWRAHRDCVAFGLEHATYCLGNCGVLMVAAMLSPSHKLMMSSVTILLLCEHYFSRPRNLIIPTIIVGLAVPQCLFA